MILVVVLSSYVVGVNYDWERRLLVKTTLLLVKYLYAIWSCRRFMDSWTEEVPNGSLAPVLVRCIPQIVDAIGHRFFPESHHASLHVHTPQKKVNPVYERHESWLYIYLHFTVCNLYWLCP
jgi:hypothetical protein